MDPIPRTVQVHRATDKYQSNIESQQQDYHGFDRDVGVVRWRVGVLLLVFRDFSGILRLNELSQFDSQSILHVEDA